MSGRRGPPKYERNRRPACDTGFRVGALAVAAAAAALVLVLGVLEVQGAPLDGNGEPDGLSNDTVPWYDFHISKPGSTGAGTGHAVVRASELGADDARDATSALQSGIDACFRLTTDKNFASCTLELTAGWNYTLTHLTVPQGTRDFALSGNGARLFFTRPSLRLPPATPGREPEGGSLFHVSSCLRCEFRSFSVDWDLARWRIASLARLAGVRTDYVSNVSSWSFDVVAPPGPLDRRTLYGFQSVHPVDGETLSIGVRGTNEYYFTSARGSWERGAADFFVPEGTPQGAEGNPDAVVVGVTGVMLHSGEGGGSGGLSPNIAEAPTRVTISFNRTINDFGNGSSSVPSPNGSLWMIKHISYEVHGFRLLNCVHCSLTDLTLLSVPGKAVIIDRGSSDVEIDGLVMDLLESPTLNSTRLMSGAADGVFASLSKGNIRIQNSRFGFHGDDAVNAHTAVSLFAVRYANATVDTSGNASLPALRYDEIHVSRSPAWRMWFSPGDTLEFFNATSYERANVTRTVVRASYSPGRGGTWTLALDAPLNPAIAPFAPNATHPFAPIPHLGLVNNAYLMRNVVIRNLTTHHHRARGVLVSPTANALLADSSFTHVQMSGILVRACAACQEGMGTSGVLVENCTLDAVDRTGWHGGIAVDATDRGWRSVGWPGLQAGVEVRETGIVNVPGPAIIMRGAASPVVFGNRFSADRTPPYEPAVAGRVLLDGCNDVVRGNNSIYSDKEGGWIRE